MLKDVLQLLLTLKYLTSQQLGRRAKSLIEQALAPILVIEALQEVVEQVGVVEHVLVRVVLLVP